MGGVSVGGARGGVSGIDSTSSTIAESCWSCDI